MNPWLQLVVYFALTLATAILLRQAVLGFLAAHGVTARNYRNVHIPVAAGVLIWLAGAAAMLILSIWTLIAGGLAPGASGISPVKELYIRLFLALTVVFCLGWTDDLLGDRAVKGLRGHIAAWIRNRTLSTGLVKALGTLAASVWLTAEAGLWNGAVFGMISVFIMVLYTNALNLFDLRPGRAIKVFLIGNVLTVVLAEHPWEAWMLLSPMIAGALVLMPMDLKGQAMLGDAGSNMLGFALGSVAALTWDSTVQLAAVIVLAGLQLYAERYSLTSMIERIPILRWLDQIGRN